MEMSTDESFAPGRPGTAVPQETSSTEEDTVSQKGIKGESTYTINGGTFDITSHDDGLNAAGGADSSGFGGFGGRPQDTFASDSDSFITINGGTFTIVSSGDCIDSNGALTINGGTLDLICNGSGDTTLDCDGTYTRLRVQPRRHDRWRRYGWSTPRPRRRAASIHAGGNRSHSLNGPPPYAENGSTVPHHRRTVLPLLHWWYQRQPPAKPGVKK